MKMLQCNWTAAAATVAGSGTAGTITATQFFTTAAAGGTAAAGATSALSAITALDVISGAATAFGALSAIRAGEEDESADLLAAQQEDQNARFAALDAKIEENNARDKMIKAYAQNIAAASESGIDIGSGTVQTGLGEIARRGNREINVARVKGDIEISNRVRQAAELRMRANNSKTRGYRDAAFGVLDQARRQMQRGSVSVT